MKESSLALLCKEYTTLSDRDIQILEYLAEEIPYTSNLTNTDIFIDALTPNGSDSIVLAWAKPKNAPSLYKRSVVGEIATPTSEPAVYQTFQFRSQHRDVRGVSQEGIPIAQTVVPVFNPDGDTIGVLIMEKDISKDLEQEEHVELLSATAERLSSTLVYLSTTEPWFEDWLGSGIFILDKLGKITYVNKTAADMYQDLFTRDPLGEDFLPLIRCDSLENASERFKNPAELTIEQNTFLFQSHPLFSYGDVSGCVMSYQDITDLRRTEQELHAQSTVIREIHHRVKNNLQSVASLLRLQSRRSNSELVRAEFEASINRIISIATVHEVFEFQSWDKVDLSELAKRVLNGLVESYLPSDQEIETVVEGYPLFVTSIQAVPLALVINELLTNSLKHGVSRVKHGKLKITIAESNQSISLTVEDNGPGLEMKTESEKDDHLGLQIVDSLIRDQLGGTFNLERHDTITRASVVIPMDLEGSK